MPHDVLLTFAQTSLSDAARDAGGVRVCDAITSVLLHLGNCSAEVLSSSYRFGSAEGDVAALAYVRMRTDASIVILDEEETRASFDAALRAGGFFSSPDARVFAVEIAHRDPGYLLGVYALLLILTMMVLVFCRDSAARARVESSLRS